MESFYVGDKSSAGFVIFRFPFFGIAMMML